jgi:hypothetical protein
VWYEIAYGERDVPVLRGKLVPTKRERLTIRPIDGSEPFLLKNPTVVQSRFECDWVNVTKKGFVVRVKARLGDLTFDVKEAGPFRSPRDAKAEARKLVAEAKEWRACL